MGKRRRLSSPSVTRISVERLDDRIAPAMLTATINPAVNNAGAVAELVGFINQANTNNQPDTISLFPFGTYTFAAAADATDGANALPSFVADGIGKNTVTLLGNMAKFVRGAPEMRYLRISGATGGANAVEVSIESLGFFGGYSKGASGAAQDGGAILVNGGATLNLKYCAFDGNKADDQGGAINFNAQSGRIEASIFGTTFVNNLAADGGAIRNTFDGFYRFDECLFGGNSASTGAGAVASFVASFEFNDACST